MQQRRVTIATETPSKELSPHYATKLEKQAFKKIKEWKEGFAIKLDQVLQQRQRFLRCPDNKVNANNVYCIADPSSHNIPSPPRSTKPEPASATLRQNTQKQLVMEFRGVSEMSMAGKSDMDDCETGSMILQEIKKQQKHSKGLEENKKLMEDLSLWHKHETGRIASDLRSCATDSQNVKRLLASLKETVDAIFVNTMQRVSDFSISSTVNAEHAYHPLQQEALLRWQIKNTQEERDRLFLQNISLRKEIAELKSRFAGVSKEELELTSVRSDRVELNSVLEHSDFEADFARIEEVQRVINCLKEYTEYESDLRDMDGRITLNSGKKRSLFSLLST